jgi:hypothetical protein
VSWQYLALWEPQRIEAMGSDLVADFGPGRGLWVLGASGWRLISWWSSEDLEAVDLF